MQQWITRTLVDEMGWQRLGQHRMLWVQMRRVGDRHLVETSQKTDPGDHKSQF